MAGPQPGEKVLTACDSEGTSVDEESGMRRCCQKIAGLCTLTTSFQSAHRRFCVRLSLACSVALWVAVLGIPLYFRTPYYAIFGSRGDAVFHHTQQFHHQEVACEADMVGRMQNIGNHTHRQYVPWTGETPWPKHEKIWSDYIWCGLLPAVWQDYWPNIAQFIVFTVYASTGDTVRLAWQGLIGTFGACLNLEMMSRLYPGGAAGAACLAEDCTPQPYNEVVVWIDVMLVLFLFLFSRADENTIKFGMSWHVFFMMDFMNPTKKMPTGFFADLTGVHLWQNDLVADVFLTSVVGAVVSILATCVPRVFCCMPPLANRVWMAQNSLEVAERIGSVWKESGEYLLGSGCFAKKQQLQRKIDDAQARLADTRQQVDSAWWETCECGKPEQVRQKLLAFLSGAAGIQRTMRNLANCIHREDFSGQHEEFCGALDHCIRELQDAASNLTVACAHAAIDGVISKQEADEVKGLVQAAASAQTRLVRQFEQAAQSGISANLAEEVTFLFVLSLWATTTQDLADVLTKPEKKTGWLTILWNGLRDTWAPQQVLDIDHLKFAFRNFLPISTCFILGFAVPSTSIFVRYSATMANTLALLITRFSTSAVQKNLHRTLGVLLGKFLPILFKAIWAVYPCQSTERGFLQLLSLFIFVGVSSYVYYSSKLWSTIAVLVGGYGVYPLMVQCDDLEEESYYGGLYREIGQVTVAILLQFVIESALHASSPAELAVRKMEQAAQCMTDGLQGFFQGDLAKMAQGLQAERYLHEAKALAAEADPAVQLAPCWRAPFKFQLYNDSLEKMMLFQGEFAMLWTACVDTDGPADETSTSQVLTSIIETPAIQDLADRLHRPVQSVMKALFQTLRHSSETPLDNGVTKEVEGFAWACGYSENQRERLYQSVANLPPMSAEKASCLVHHPKARGTVAIHALENAIKHLDDMSCLVIAEDIF